MTSNFLDVDDFAIIEQHMADIAESDLDGYWSFWDCERIKLDGDFTLEGLQALVNAMTAMREQRRRGEVVK